MCWYEPPEESKQLIKNLCRQLVDEIKKLEERGGPIGLHFQDVKKLIDHLYDPSCCQENKQQKTKEPK